MYRIICCMHFKDQPGIGLAMLSVRVLSQKISVLKGESIRQAVFLWKREG